MHIFPWVLGIRGLIDPSCIVSLFTFLDVSRKHHKTAIERTVLASVKALYFMHQVRFGGMHDRHRFADNPRNDSSDEDATDDEELRSDPYGKIGLPRQPASELQSYIISWYLTQYSISASGWTGNLSFLTAVHEVNRLPLEPQTTVAHLTGRLARCPT